MAPFVPPKEFACCNLPFIGIIAEVPHSFTSKLESHSHTVRDMKGTSNLIMLLILVLLVSLAMVLGLVLLLIAELYCSPLLRRRHNRRRQARTLNATGIGDNSSIHSLSHSQSPLDSFLYPADANDDLEKQLTQTQSPENQDSARTHQQDKIEMRNGSNLVYISNPVFDGESGRESRVEDDGTPFETPDTSPSRLETEESSCDDEREEISSTVVVTPPLTPMKKLPAEAVSVCLKDVRSLGTSGSDTDSNNGASSSSLTPCTSPSL